MKKESVDKALAVVCTAILFAFFLSILLVAFARQILVKRGIQNFFTEFVFRGNEAMQDDDSVETKEADRDIDWQTLFPFGEDDSTPEQQLQEMPWNRYEKAVGRIEKKISGYSSDQLFRREDLVELSRDYDGLIGWNFASYSEYNGVVELPDGYLTSLWPHIDMTECTDSLSSFADFCKERGISFLYVQAPYKISEYDDPELSGIVDFSFQNATELVENLRQNDVEVLDFRELIRQEGVRNRSLFFRTDHHWLPSTGLWASQEILKYLNQEYGFQADTSLLEKKLFTETVYPEWFLGSEGKKVTLARTTPDDFSLLYPDYPSEFHYRIPSLELDKEGDLSVFYDMRQVEEKDYYHGEPYSAYHYGNRPLEEVENLLDAEDHKVLFIGDSFGNVVKSGIALCEKNMKSLDLRYFTGSVRTFVEETEPDIVIVLYCPASFTEKIDWTTHASMFDFR